MTYLWRELYFRSSQLRAISANLMAVNVLSHKEEYEVQFSLQKLFSFWSPTLSSCVQLDNYPVIQLVDRSQPCCPTSGERRLIIIVIMKVTLSNAPALDASWYLKADGVMVVDGAGWVSCSHYAPDCHHLHHINNINLASRAFSDIVCN